MMHRGFRLGTVVLLLLVICAPSVLAQGESGDKVVFNEVYTLAAGDMLRGNLAVVGGSVTLEQGSTVTGDVAVFGGQMVANGDILGGVAAFGGRVTLGDSAVLEGDFASLGGHVDVAPEAVIHGEMFLGLRSLGLGRRTPWSSKAEVSPPLGGLTELLGQFVLWQLRTFGGGLLLALLSVVALLVAPKGVGRVATAAATQPAVSLGMGLLTLLVALFAGALLLIACGLGLLVWLVLLAGLLLGWMGIGLWVGQRVLGAFKVLTASSVAEMISGVFLITVLAGLPLCIGFFFWLILGSIGLGAVVLTRFGTQSAEDGVPASVSAPLPPYESEGPVALVAPEVTETESPAEDSEPAA